MGIFLKTGLCGGGLGEGFWSGLWQGGQGVKIFFIKKCLKKAKKVKEGKPLSQKRQLLATFEHFCQLLDAVSRGKIWHAVCMGGVNLRIHDSGSIREHYRKHLSGGAGFV